MFNNIFNFFITDFRLWECLWKSRDNGKKMKPAELLWLQPLKLAFPRLLLMVRNFPVNKEYILFSRIYCILIWQNRRPLFWRCLSHSQTVEHLLCLTSAAWPRMSRLLMLCKCPCRELMVCKLHTKANINRHNCINIGQTLLTLFKLTGRHYR